MPITPTRCSTVSHQLRLLLSSTRIRSCPTKKAQKSLPNRSINLNWWHLLHYTPLTTNMATHLSRVLHIFLLLVLYISKSSSAYVFPQCLPASLLRPSGKRRNDSPAHSYPHKTIIPGADMTACVCLTPDPSFLRPQSLEYLKYFQEIGANKN